MTKYSERYRLDFYCIFNKIFYPPTLPSTPPFYEQFIGGEGSKILEFVTCCKKMLRSHPINFFNLKISNNFNFT